MDGLAYLARSETRPAVLAELDAADGLERRGLRERVDASRSTVTRALDRMVEFGWVREDDGRVYRLTALGAFVADAYERVREDLETAAGLSAFLSRVPDEAFDLDPRLLAGARVTEATAAEPLAPIDRVTTIRAESTTVRELSTVVARESVEQVRERADEGEAAHEIVLSAEVVESLTNGSDYAEAFEATDAAGVDYHVHDGDIPFLLALLDDRVALGVVDDEDRPVVLVESTDDRVYEWAEATFEAYRDAADPL